MDCVVIGVMIRSEPMAKVTASAESAATANTEHDNYSTSIVTLPSTTIVG